MALSKSVKKVLAAIPIVNFFFQFFLITPDIETVTKLFDIMGLLSALLLVVVYAVPGTLSLDELVAADVKFGHTADMATNPPPKSAYTEWWSLSFSWSPSYIMGASMALAGFFFSVVFFGVIFQYVYVGFARAMIKHTQVEFRNAAWKKWYICNAIVTIVLLVMLVIGMVSFYLGIFILCVIKWPDLGLELVQIMGTWATVNIRKESTVYTDLAVFNVLVPVAAVVVLCIGGLGNYFVYSNLVDHEISDKEKADVADAGFLEVHERTKQGTMADAQVHPAPFSADGRVRSESQL